MVCNRETNANDKILIGVVIVSRDLVCQAHRYVLNNTNEVQAYINEHMKYIRRASIQLNQEGRMGN